MKKRLDILLNKYEVETYREIKDTCELTFAQDFSQEIDGVKLFEMYSKLSKDIELRYKNNCIIALIPKNKDSLRLVIKAIETAKEARR